jgi:hypothetical protein
MAPQSVGLPQVASYEANRLYFLRHHDAEGVRHGGILATVRGHTAGSVHFTGIAPGTYSNPLLLVLLAVSAYLPRRLHSSPSLGSRREPLTRAEDCHLVEVNEDMLR